MRSTLINRSIYFTRCGQRTHRKMMLQIFAVCRAVASNMQIYTDLEASPLIWNKSRLLTKVSTISLVNHLYFNWICYETTNIYGLILCVWEKYPFHLQIWKWHCLWSVAHLPFLLLTCRSFSSSRINNCPPIDCQFPQHFIKVFYWIISGELLKTCDRAKIKIKLPATAAIEKWWCEMAEGKSGNQIA